MSWVDCGVMSNDVRARGEIRGEISPSVTLSHRLKTHYRMGMGILQSERKGARETKEERETCVKTDLQDLVSSPESAISSCCTLLIHLMDHYGILEGERERGREREGGREREIGRAHV